MKILSKTNCVSVIYIDYKIFQNSGSNFILKEKYFLEVEFIIVWKVNKCNFVRYREVELLKYIFKTRELLFITIAILTSLENNCSLSIKKIIEISMKKQ